MSVYLTREARTHDVSTTVEPGRVVTSVVVNVDGAAVDFEKKSSSV